MTDHENGSAGPGPELDDEHLLDHSYDGIQEYDNPLPRWWLLLFWASIVLTPLYILYFHYGPGLLAHDRYDKEMVEFFDKQAKELLALGEITETVLVDTVSDSSLMSSGKKIFQTKCATCHGVFGEGGIGPNLTDQYWLHGGQFSDIYRTVREGVPTKGMVAWERQLRPAELIAVTSYVGSLLGSSPPNPKAPQGEVFERQPPSEEPTVEADVGAATDEPESA